MQIETRSRCQMPSGSAAGGRNRLKDVSNALTTSKELLKIISRMWGHEDQSSSSMSLISALHAELERARLQINQLIQEDRTDSSKEIHYLLKRFAEEKAAWKNKEQEALEAAIESISGELEVERKLRRRLESLNKKLGKELGETKSSLLKAVKELQSEKKARGMVEQVCDELAGNYDEDRAHVAEMNRESLRMQEELEKEREMLQVAEALRKDRTQMKLSDAKHQLEEKNAAVDKLRSNLQSFLRTNSSKDNGCGSVYRRRDGNLAFCRSEAGESNQGEVENTSDDDDDDENSDESDLHSIELNTGDQYKNYKLACASMTPRNVERHSVDEQLKGRKSIFNQVARRSTSLLRSVSNIVEWGNGSNHETDKQSPRRSCGDEIQRHKLGKSHKDHGLPSSRLGLEREVGSPSHRGLPWPSQEPCNVVLQRPMNMEGHNSRRSKR